MKRWLLLLVLLTATRFVAVHDDNGCADAVDFSMRPAQNREFGYPLDIVVNSAGPQFRVAQHCGYEAPGDGVYAHHWTRFQATLGAAESCEPQW